MLRTLVLSTLATLSLACAGPPAPENEPTIYYITPTPASVDESSVTREPLIFEPPVIEEPTPLQRDVQAAAVGGAEPLPLTESQMREVLREAGWPEGRLTEEALAVSFCESRWRWWVAGDNGVSVGLFQLGIARPNWRGWFLYYGVPEELAFDPVVNARVALQARLQRGYWGGTGGWSCADLLGIP